MKRKVIVRFAIAGASLLLTGAVAVGTVDKLLFETPTVGSVGELVVDCKLKCRSWNKFFMPLPVE